MNNHGMFLPNSTKDFSKQIKSSMLPTLKQMMAFYSDANKSVCKHFNKNKPLCGTADIERELKAKIILR